MNPFGLIAVGVGAACGAWLRWALGIALNPLLPNLPIGTLAANLAGGFLIGYAVAFFDQHAGLAPEWRLALITGFLGALTTFSTFSAEVVGLLSRAQYGWALATSALHLFGSLAMTALGIASFHLLRG